jgi:thioredoxin reductase
LDGRIMHGMTDPAKPTGEETVPGRGPAVDVVVAGGGLAGLAGALILARARRSVLVVDDGRPRNAPAAHAHGYLSRDGVPPLELLAFGRAEVAGYGGTIIAGTVTCLARLPGGGFVVTLADGTGRRARRVLIATGLVDEYPDIPGWPSAGDGTSCTVRSALAGSCGTRRWGS